MVSSTELPCVSVSSTPLSQIEALAATFAALAGERVNVHVDQNSVLGQPLSIKTPPNSLSNATDGVDITKPSVDDQALVYTETAGFNRLPLEIKIRIFEFVFIQNTPQEFSVKLIETDDEENMRQGVTPFLNVNTKLLRVARIWNQYGSAMIFENTFSTSSSDIADLCRRIDSLDSHSRCFLQSIKHLDLSVGFFCCYVLEGLKYLENLQEVCLYFVTNNKQISQTIYSTDPKDNGDYAQASRRLISERLDGCELVDFFMKEALKTVKLTVVNEYVIHEEMSDGEEAAPLAWSLESGLNENDFFNDDVLLRSDFFRRYRHVLVQQLILAPESAKGWDIVVLRDELASTSIGRKV